MPQKRRSSLGSVRQDGPGVWRVRVSKGRDPATGARVYRERRVRGSRRDADAALALMLAQAGDGPAASRMALGDYLTEVYLPWCAARLRENTVDHYRCDVELHIAPAVGRVPIGELGPMDVESMLAGIAGPGARKSAYKTLRQALRQARRWRLVRDVATDAVPEPKVPRYEPRVLTRAEAADVLAAFEGSEVETAVLVALGCGLRRSEICALDWEDLGPGCRTVDVSKSYSVVGGEGRMHEPKTYNSRRTVSVPPAFAARLEALRPPGASGPVLVGAQGGRMNPDVLTALYERRARERGVRYTAFRNLRHSHATMMLEADVDVVTVSRRLGHSSVSITDRFYLRPRGAADERAAEAFDALGVASPHLPANGGGQAAPDGACGGLRTPPDDGLSRGRR